MALATLSCTTNRGARFLALAVSTAKAMSAPFSSTSASRIRHLDAFLRRGAPGDNGVSGLDLHNNVKKAIFIRHGQSLANSMRKEYKEAGRLAEYLKMGADFGNQFRDPPLNDTGVSQAAALGARLRRRFPHELAGGRFEGVALPRGGEAEKPHFPTSTSQQTMSTTASTVGSLGDSSAAAAGGRAPLSGCFGGGGEASAPHQPSGDATAPPRGAVPPPLAIVDTDHLPSRTPSKSDGPAEVEIWVSPMRRTIETAQNVFFSGEKGHRFDRLVPDAREYFEDDFAAGRECAVVGGDYLGYEWHDEAWEQKHKCVQHITDEERMDRLHEQILTSDAENIFVVCHWGTIVNYLNRFCVNLNRDTPANGGWRERTGGDFDLPAGFGKCGEGAGGGMLEYLSPENCSVSTVEYS